MQTGSNNVLTRYAFCVAFPIYGVELALKLKAVDGVNVKNVNEAFSLYWYEYVLPFESFTLANKDYLPHVANPLSSGSIERIGFTLQYYFKNSRGNGQPLYTNDNLVFIDNMYFIGLILFPYFEKG